MQAVASMTEQAIQKQAILRQLDEAADEVKKRRQCVRVARLALKVALLEKQKIEARLAALEGQPGAQLELQF
jgi:hypothetical protein